MRTRVKIISHFNESSLQAMINGWLEENKNFIDKIVDIKYTTIYEIRQENYLKPWSKHTVIKFVAYIEYLRVGK